MLILKLAIGSRGAADHVRGIITCVFVGAVIGNVIGIRVDKTNRSCSGRNSRTDKNHNRMWSRSFSLADQFVRWMMRIGPGIQAFQVLEFRHGKASRVSRQSCPLSFADLLHHAAFADRAGFYAGDRRSGSVGSGHHAMQWSQWDQYPQEHNA